MTSYVALLGGINVGGRVLRMERLRAIAEECGFGDVSTYIQSGNLLFTSRHGAARVAGDLHDALLVATGIDSRVVVRTATELATVVARNPHAGRTEDATKVSVSFLFPPAAPTLDALDPSVYAPDEVVVLGEHAYLFTPKGMGTSKLVPKVVRALGITGTVRNWRTVQKLAELAGRA